MEVFAGSFQLIFVMMPVDLLAHIFHEQLSLSRPAIALADVVEGYYHVTWDGREEDVWACLDGVPVLVFILDPPYRLAFRGGHNKVFQWAFFCCFGLQETFIAYIPRGLRLLVVRFTSSGLYHLQPQSSAGVMRSALCSIGEVWGIEGEQLAMAISAISDAGNDAAEDEQQRLLETFLLRKLPICTAINYVLQLAVQLAGNKRGQISVSEICRMLRVNYKWLERNFRRYLGITPKAYLANIRFLHAYFSLMKGNADLTGIALENGYYDQNHFIRDCKKFTGHVPSTITSLYLQAPPVL
jgi:AraC-like DNA-binding protein